MVEMLKEQVKKTLTEMLEYGLKDGLQNDEMNDYADQILALFPQGDKDGVWVFKTDKLTPLQVKSTVCHQCPFPGELETKCDWCDNPKLIEFLWLAIPAIDDFYNQSKQAALKEQMERVRDKLPEVARQQISQKHSLWFDDVDSTEIDELVDAIVEALKAELEGEGLVLEHGCRYLNSEFECEKGLLISGKCPSECIYYDDGSR